MRISVAIPTYKRLPQLKRAVDDVKRQTYTDWELVISDDEEGEGETWTYLCALAAADDRIKILKNTRGGHGQAYNVNSALLACTGDWIKPLFDDDGLLPDCLAELVKVVNGSLAKETGVVMAGCRAEKWRNGIRVGEDANCTTHGLEVVTAQDTHLAMCLLDRWNGRTPTHVMVRGDIVRSGALMGEDGFVRHPLDVRWFGCILAHGAFAMTDKVLVCERQGEVESGTSQLRREERVCTEENRKVYLEIWDRAARDARWPSRLAVDSLVCGIRGLYHLRRRQFAWAIRYLFLMLRSPRGCVLTFRAFRAFMHPDRHSATERRFA